MENYLTPFSISEKDFEFPLDDIDPDINFYNELMFQSISMCKYYSEESFNINFGHKNSNLSMCHLNIRSMSQNFSAFTDYLQLLSHSFTLIGLSETWLSDVNCDLFHLQGYNFIEKHRATRTGGGIGLFYLIT